MRAARTAAIGLAAAWLWGAPLPARAQGFRGQFTGPTQALGRALADTVARALPVLSASPGVTFAYDPASGGFTRGTDLVGQLYLERAQPIGRKKWNVALGYQHVQVDSIQGQEADSLSDTGLPIVIPGDTRGDPDRAGGRLVKFERYAVDLTVNQVTLAATYGVTDDLDLNLTLPILASALGIDASLRAFTVNPNDGRLVPASPSQKLDRFEDGSTRASGVGDMLLRAKYRFLARPWGQLAGALMLRMPTGDQDDFQGTGTWELSPLVFASTRRFPVARGMAVGFHFNGGLDLNIDDVDESQGRFGIGADLAIGTRATLSLAFLAREPFHGFASAGSFDVNRYNPPTRCPGLCDRPGPTAPLFGLETARPSYYSLSIGGRANLWRDTVFGFANVLIPLLDEGIHTDPIPLVGFEATF